MTPEEHEEYYRDVIAPADFDREIYKQCAVQDEANNISQEEMLAMVRLIAIEDAELLERLKNSGY